MTKRLETFGGNHIRDCVAKAVALAIKSGESVEFAFNDKTYRAEPTDTYETAKVRAETVLGHPILTADEESEQARRSLEETAARQAADIAAAQVPTEKELQAADVPWPKTAQELSDYIAKLVDRPHDYGTCVYAMSMAAVAAYHYVAHELGTTGFQASCADLDIVRRTRHIKGPFMLIDLEQALYPQYNLREKLDEFLAEQRAWLADEARKRLAENDRLVHPDVRRHWESLVEA